MASENESQSPTDNKPKKVTFEYARASDYQVIAANAVWGGLTGKGDIIFDLLLEKHPVPISVTHDVGEAGKLTNESREYANAPEEGTLKVIREAQIGVVMRPENAESVANWLLEKVKEFRRVHQSPEGVQPHE